MKSTLKIKQFSHKIHANKKELHKIAYVGISGLENRIKESPFTLI